MDKVYIPVNSPCICGSDNIMITDAVGDEIIITDYGWDETLLCLDCNRNYRLQCNDGSDDDRFEFHHLKLVSHPVRVEWPIPWWKALKQKVVSYFAR